MKKIGVVFFFILSILACKRELTVEDLFSAALDDDTDLIQQCLEQGIDIDAKDGLGSTILSRSLHRAKVETIQFILENGANPQAIRTLDAPASVGILTLGTAQVLHSSPSSPQKTKLLLEYGADPNKFGDSEVSPLMYYVYRLSKASTDEDAAAILASMRLLLEYGADPNYRGEESGLSALLTALNYDRRDAVDLLLAYGATPSIEPARVDFHHDPLNFKKYDKNYGVVWQSELDLFAAAGYEDLLMPYIESGEVDPYLATPNGWDFFYYAVTSGDAAMVKALRPYCKDLNDRFYDYMGETSAGVKRNSHRSLLMVAVEQNSYEIAKYLLEEGIDPNLVGYDMETVWVTANDYAEGRKMLRLMIKYDASRAEFLLGYPNS